MSKLATYVVNTHSYVNCNFSKLKRFSSHDAYLHNYLQDESPKSWRNIMGTGKRLPSHRYTACSKVDVHRS